jgi:hypothetical protein
LTLPTRALTGQQIVSAEGGDRHGFELRHGRRFFAEPCQVRRRRAAGATLAELARSYHVGNSTIPRLRGDDLATQAKARIAREDS